MLKEKLETKKCFSTAWGRLITEEEAYRQLNRQIAAMTANLFQVMRIFEPNWEKRTAAICNIANMMNMAVAGSPDEQKNYVNAALYEAFNIPELCEKSSSFSTRFRVNCITRPAIFSHSSPESPVIPPSQLDFSQSSGLLKAS